MLQKISNEFKRPSKLKDKLTNNSLELSFYELIFAIEDESTKFKTYYDKDNKIDIFIGFTSREAASSYSQSGNIVAIMLGKFIKEISNNERIAVIGLNPNNHRFDEFVFAPFYDDLTKQYLISPRDESIALLSIDKRTHNHMGVEATFFSINNKFLPDDGDQREKLLAELIDDLSFMIPRMTQPLGSANIICLLLNLDNPVEEKAFIRKYPTIDPYIEVLFVTSELKLLTGELEEISYDGANLEGVFTPIIKRKTKE